MSVIMSGEAPTILRPHRAPSSIHVTRLGAGEPADGPVDRLWLVEWDLPDGFRYLMEIFPVSSWHLTIEEGGVSVHDLMPSRFGTALHGRGRLVLARLRPSSPDASLVAGPAPPSWSRGLRAALGSADATAGAVSAVIARRPTTDRVDMALVDRAAAMAADDPEVTTVADLATRSGVTVRTLQRSFRRYLGVGPKQILQRRRVRDVLRRIHAGISPDWAGLAHELGFADRAHLNRVFRDLIGEPPGAYLRQCRSPDGGRVAAAVGGGPSP